MTPDEIQEFHTLSDKRDRNALTEKEYKRYLVLVNTSFDEGLPKIVKSWMEGFNL